MDAPPARIAELRRRCLARWSEDRYWRGWLSLTAQSLKASEAEPSWQIRQGLETRDRLSRVRLAVNDAELLMGRLAPLGEVFSDEQEAEAQQYLERYPPPGGQTGHCELDMTRLLTVGVAGIADEIRARMADADAEARAVYPSFLHALEGLSALAENAALAAEAAMPDATPARREELRVMADVCRHVAHRAPTSFREAIQILWFADMAVMFGDGVGLVGPGHMDRNLLPFFEADLAKGVLTEDEALVLIECLYILINEFIPRGLAIPAMVGGRDAEGRDVTNRLSYLCLEALRRTDLVYPTVGVCWHEGTPQGLSDLAVDLIGHGCTTPAFFGDETIQRGLKALGCPPEQACNYINSTCVEITPVGASNVWVASPYFSLCSLLLDEIEAQVADKAAPDFDAFVAAYRCRLADAVTEGVNHQNELRDRRRLYGGKPLQSVLTRDCIERARDIDDGGAAYNWVECSFVGIANLADSLHVIREEVYRQRRLSLAEVKAVLDADFAGHEETRRRFLDGYPKYGVGCVEVDALVAETMAFAVEECRKHRMAPDDSPFVPGAFCWTMHQRLGALCGATPDGRRAGVPFADGGGPAQGREKRGPTAAILSTTSWDHSPLIGGLAFNMKFNTSLFTAPDAFDRLRDLIVTYLRRGGFEVQVNVVDHETLRKAKENPDEYADLVVRIGGYTDYFTRLTPAMQDEVMMRAEFGSV